MGVVNIGKAHHVEVSTNSAQTCSELSQIIYYYQKRLYTRPIKGLSCLAYVNEVLTLSKSDTIKNISYTSYETIKIWKLG